MTSHRQSRKKAFFKKKNGHVSLEFSDFKFDIIRVGRRSCEGEPFQGERGRSSCLGSFLRRKVSENSGRKPSAVPLGGPCVWTRGLRPSLLAWSMSGTTDTQY